MPSPIPDEAEADQPLAMRWTIGRVATVVAVLAMVGFWAWIFAGGPQKENPDRLDDRAFVARTEKRCRALRSDLKALPNAAVLTDAADRAELLDDANALVTGMVDEIEADAPERGEDAASVSGWITDWRLYLADRADYADRLRRDPEAQLLLSRSELGDSVDKTIEIFAQVNDMRDCATPGDVG